MKLLIIFSVIIILLLIYFSYSEKFISYMNDELSEYGPTPWIILVKQIPTVPLNYSEIDKYNKTLKVMEIFNNQTYKIYCDDGLVREGLVPGYLWDYVMYLIDIAPDYANKNFCEFTGKDLMDHYAVVVGYRINLGIFAIGCTPTELFPIKKLFNLMDNYY